MWIPIAMFAGLMQAVRTAGQKRLNADLSTWMTTYVRSIWGLPFMVAYLWVVVRYEGLGAPRLHGAYLATCFAAGASQVAGTFLLIRLFRMSNFAVGTMLTKTDLMQAAIIGSLLFNEAISAAGWAAIALTVGGVFLLSGRAAGEALAGRRLADFLCAPATLTGLASGFLFSLSYLFLREASLVLEQGSHVYRGAWSVVIVTSMQVVFLGAWLAATERAEFAKLPRLVRPSIFVGITSAAGSIGWFTAMAMQNASYVKAVGQVEVVFTVLISTLYFRERITLRQYAGIITIVLAVILFVL